MGFTILGGVGFFLLGMILMSEGLQGAAGNTLRVWLVRFTRGPVSSITTGFVFTTLVQSSSVSTIATVGFVSAGLLSFTQSIGIILGANLGTTTTSWIVAVIGLKIDLQALAFPMLAVGSLIRLLAKGKKKRFGEMIAGFGLLFIGIDFMKDSMAGVADAIDIDAFVSPGILGRFILVILGMVISAITQNSAAAVATTITALSAGSVTFDQAAALVLGNKLGALIMIVIAALSATTPAKRTAAAHLLFNFITVGIVFVFLGPILFVLRAGMNAIGVTDEATMLAAFHSSVNIIGISLFFPFLKQFAAFLERILPDKHGELTWRLKDQEDSGQEVALQAARLTMQDIALGAVELLDGVIVTPKNIETLKQDTISLSQAHEETWEYLAIRPSSKEDSEHHALQLATLHAGDHLGRLLRIADKREAIESLCEDGDLKETKNRVLASIRAFRAAVTSEPNGAPLAGERSASKILAEHSSNMAAHRKVRRTLWLSEAAGQKLSAELLSGRLIALHWADSFIYHLWRLTEHLDPNPEYSAHIEDDRH